MFKIEIHGYFKTTPSSRELKNIDFIVNAQTKDKYFFTTPCETAIKNKDYMVFSFYRNDFAPYLPITLLNDFVNNFYHLKDKILIELLFCCTDTNITKKEKSYISLNQATMNSFKYQATVFYNEADDIFYYTYENDGLHIVWIENTETLLNKARLIESKDFKGIFIRDVPLALDGNWEALYNINHSF